MALLINVVLLCFLFELNRGEQVCGSTEKSGNAYKNTYMYCPEICCGDVISRQCCESGNQAVIIGAVLGAAVFLLLAIGLTICCMKNSTRKQTRVAVIQIGEAQNVSLRRDERREQRRQQRMQEAAMEGQFAPNIPQYEPPPYSAAYPSDVTPFGTNGGLGIAPPAYSMHHTPSSARQGSRKDPHHPTKS